MPYGIPLTQQERIVRHQSIYGGTPPSVRMGVPQEMNTNAIAENYDLIVLVGGLIAGWVFIDFVLPNITKK